MDDIVFENEYEITKQFIRSEYKLSQKRSGKLNLWVSHGSTVFYVVILSVYAVFSRNILICAFNTLVVVLLLTYPYFIVPAQTLKGFARLSGVKTLPSPIIRTVSFGESILMQTGNTAVTYSYDKVRYIEENDEYIYFWIGTLMIVPLYKNSFTIGNSDDFTTFLYEKCSELGSLRSKRKLFWRDFISASPLIIFDIAVLTYICLKFMKII